MVYILNSIIVFWGILNLFKFVFVVVECGKSRGINELYFSILCIVVFKYGKFGLFVNLGSCFFLMMLFSF